jgi:hypothetical protein
MVARQQAAAETSWPFVVLVRPAVRCRRRWVPRYRAGHLPRGAAPRAHTRFGEPRRSPDATIEVVLEDLTQGGGHAHFGVDISGRTLHATDIDWSYGSGPPLRGSAEDLVLHICGRKVPAGQLQGR